MKTLLKMLRDYVSKFALTGLSLSALTTNAQIHLISPNGGEILVPGSTYTITYSDPSAPTYPADISYSTDGGATFHYVTSAITGFVWTVPNMPSTQCLIEVLGAGTVDTSDAVFTITASGTSGIANDKIGQVKLFPNPCADFFTIQTGLTQKIKSVELYNILGEKVKDIQNIISNGQIRVDTSELTLETYIVKINTREGFLSARIIISK